jgi:hypothetical protein
VCRHSGKGSSRAVTTRPRSVVTSGRRRAQSEPSGRPAPTAPYFSAGYFSAGYFSSWMDRVCPTLYGESPRLPGSIER